MSDSFQLNIDPNGIANLIFDLPNEKVNKLSTKVLLELEAILQSLKNNNLVKILLIKSTKKDIFIAGADIAEIADIKIAGDAFAKVSKGQEILNQLENLPFPTISIINGACLGGGLELALASKYRIAIHNNKTQLGLPEVNLGIIPGFGGTQRLPKLIGLTESLKIILSGRAVDARKAFKIGLVDMIAREEFLSESLDNFTQLILQNPSTNIILTKRRQAQKKRCFMENFVLRKLVIYPLTRKDLFEKTKDQYPAPIAALEVIKKTYGIKNTNQGFKIEAEAFSKLVIGTISKNLIKLFFIGEKIKNDPGATVGKDLGQIKKAGVLGAGVMGGGIAWLFSNYDIDVRMKDISQNAIALGFSQVLKIYKQLLKIGKYDENQISLKMNNISADTNYRGFSHSDIVVEAIVENLEIKKKSLAELENYLSDNAIIASNTSSLSITKMASTLKHPQRFIGMHFFNPVNRMPLIEIIRGDQTSDETVARVVALSKKLGKTPIVVKDVPGFLVNRILIPYINEAGFLLEEGVGIQKVDKLIEDFGMKMGPFLLSDVVGLDVGYKVIKILHEGYGERMKPCKVLEEISQNKDLLGKKSSKGFFLYDKKGARIGVNPQIDSILSRITSSTKLASSTLSDDDIINRCFLLILNEAARCIEEGVVSNNDYVDMALIMGTGFPAFRGGIFGYLDNFGVKKAVEQLQKFSQKYGNRFEPCKLLLDMARKEAA